MIIQCDTREHDSEWARVEQQLDALGVQWFRNKLYIGDYMCLDNPKLVIDRKKNLEELCSNIFSEDHNRFRREMIRAQELGVQIIILIEHGKDIQGMNDIIWWDRPETVRYRKVDGKWVNYTVKRIAGESLVKAMHTISEKYGIKYAFCDKSSTGEAIVRIFEHDQRRNKDKIHD